MTTKKIFFINIFDRYRKTKIDCLRFVMCLLLASGFQRLIFDAAINSTNEANNAGGMQIYAVYILRCLWDILKHCRFCKTILENVIFVSNYVFSLPFQSCPLWVHERIAKLAVFYRPATIRDQCYKTVFIPNLRPFVLSQSVCPWQVLFVGKAWGRSHKTFWHKFTQP